VQSNVQVIVTPKAADEVTPPSDEVTPPADEVTPSSDEGSATGSCDAPVDANASQYPAWSASKIYNSGDTVSADNLVWKAKYWTQGNKP
ncbi:carbohydrate-binding protein, partial [Klebsiella variicola]|uniref:carbohydrate-binding protein n=1 Tax=Klebsiella variicola TaxID=244366 RepID=UPI0034D5FCCA